MRSHFYRFSCFIACLGLLTPILVVSQPARSQILGTEGEVTSFPLCSNVINQTGQKIYGTISMAPSPRPDGTKVRNVQNFMLSQEEKVQICAQGPFFAGQTVELTLKSLIPLFSCRTRLDGDIILSKTQDSDGVNHFNATCH